MSSGFIPCCCRFAAIRRISCTDSESTSDFGSVSVVFSRRPFSAWSFSTASSLRFSSSFRFDSTSARRSSTLPDFMPNAFANSASSGGTLGNATSLTVSVNCAVFPATSLPW